MIQQHDASKPTAADVCDCSCHRGSPILHLAQCCEPCPKCGRDIRLERYRKHRKSCLVLMPEAIRRGMGYIGLTNDALRAQLRELTGRDPTPNCECKGKGLFVIGVGFDMMEGAFVTRQACLDCYPEMAAVKRQTILDKFAAAGITPSQPNHPTGAP